MRLLLAIDTAGERCSAALLDLETGAILATADPQIGRGHAEILMDVIGTVLRTAGATYRDIAKLAVGVGPGSFTGIRVAVATGRGLELSLGIPAVGVSTLEALAEPHWSDAGVLAIHDAKRGEVYAALYTPGGEELKPPAALDPAELSEFCRSATSGLRLAGSGAAIAAPLLTDLAPVVVSTEGAADIKAIARIGWGRAPGAPPLPLYLRGADARAQARPGLRARIASTSA